MCIFKQYLIFLIIYWSILGDNECKNNFKSSSVEDIDDVKEFKKILRTKNNVLALFINNHKRSAPILKEFNDAADIIKGQGTMLLIDCNSNGKKLCKKLKVTPDDYTLRHYKDGEFNKEYDRKETVRSLVNFMKDPMGDLPWEEEPTAVNVTHVPDPQSLQKLLKKEQRPVMVMFYAPWCGYCKKMKPDYAAAASELKDVAVMAAIDVNRPENAPVRAKHNITGFPTLLYFQNGEMKYTYEGDNKKEKLVEFMRNPERKVVRERDVDWNEASPNVVHLTDQTFDKFLMTTKSVLVMFYAPWCGHCRLMKPEYEKAAQQIKDLKINGVLAAVDATKETVVASRFGINGYPTVKYFKNGSFAFDVQDVREANKIVKFMRNPAQEKPSKLVEKEIPWSHENSDVVHLTTENIKPELRKKRHALVMFYAPWCGHCKKAKPEYTLAAEQLNENARVILGAVDCSENDTLCKTFNVKGYPSFKYFHYYNKATVDYNGGRTASDFVNYILNAETNILKDLLQAKDEL